MLHVLRHIQELQVTVLINPEWDWTIILVMATARNVRLIGHHNLGTAFRIICVFSHEPCFRFLYDILFIAASAYL